MNEELPDGTTLRKQTKGAIIDEAPYAKLKKRIIDLKRRGNDEEIYRLLNELKEWEIHGGRAPDSMVHDEGGASEVVEWVDIASTEDAEVIDVEASVENLLSETTSTDNSAANNIPDQVTSDASSLHREQPLPDQVPSVTSVVRTQQQQRQRQQQQQQQRAVIVAVGDHEAEAAEGKGHEVVNLLCSSDEDDDMNTKAKHWTKEEDDTLCNTVIKSFEESGSKDIDWAIISSQVGPGRTSLQCWERYNKLSKNPCTTRSRQYQASVPLPDLTAPQIKGTSKGKISRAMAVPSHEETSFDASSPSLPPDTQDAFINITDSSISSRMHISPEEKIKANIASAGDDDQASLKTAWNRQTSLRAKGKWKPSGGWKPPAWACKKTAIKMKRKVDSAVDAPTKNKNEKDTDLKTAKRRKKNTNASSCSKHALARAKSLLAESMQEGTGMAAPNEVTNLSQLKCTGYAKKVTEDLLLRAHRAQQGLLPATDCDEWEVVKIARSYYNYWRPATGNVKAILLAESHSKTEKDQMTSTRLDPSLCPQYLGPRNYIKLVHCLAYGELNCIASRAGQCSKKRAAVSSIAQQNDSGTSQFWTLLAAASRGTNYVPGNVRGGNSNRGKHAFATDVLKMGGLSVEDRLEAKLSILQQLKDRGIWLIDVSVIGWYISQEQKYRRSARTNEIHRMAKERPPKELKPASMVLSWELLTKHVIREAAEEGGLNLLVLIGKELENILSIDRITEAVTSRGTTAGPSSAHRCKIETIPAPNAWSKFFLLE